MGIKCQLPKENLFNKFEEDHDQNIYVLPIPKFASGPHIVVTKSFSHDNLCLYDYRRAVNQWTFSQ